MRLLLDTHILLWSLAEPQRLSALARRALEDARNEVFVSPVSVWEIAIKRALGKLKAPDILETDVVDRLPYRAPSGRSQGVGRRLT